MTKGRKTNVIIEQAEQTTGFSWKKILNTVFFKKHSKKSFAPQTKADTEASNNSAVILKAHKAEENYQPATINPNNTNTYADLTPAVQESDHLHDAEKTYRQIIATQPDCIEAYNNLAIILQELGRLQEAEENYRRAIAINPNYIEIYGNLGVTLQKLGRLQEAEENYRRAIIINPNYAETYNNLAIVLQELGRLNEAAENYRLATAINPNYAEAYNNLGSILQKLGYLQEAEKNYQLAVAINPDYAEAHHNLGIILKELGRFDESEVSYQKALLLRPTYIDSHCSFALLLLLLGRFEQGLLEYRWMYHPDNPTKPKMPQVSARQWQGEPLQGKTILIYSEQGFGDMIQFVRYAEQLKANGATVWVLAAKPLVELFKTIPWIERVLHENEQYQAAYDFWVFPLILPLWFQTTLETVPVTVPYLSANIDKSAWWQHWLDQQIPSGHKRIGLVWAGNPHHHNDRNRSIAFRELTTLLDIANITFVSLQLGDKARADIANRANILDAGLFIQDFMDSAALLECLDLLITVDSAPAHLAGAMNIPTWVLITKLPDWRWLLHRSDSVWYKSVRLFRQSESGNWASVLTDVKAALAMFDK